MSTPVIDPRSPRPYRRGMTLGEFIRQFREARSWTLEELSLRSTVDVGTISALEMRKSRRSQFAAQLAAAFGVSTDDLLTGRDRPPLNKGQDMGTGPERDSTWSQKTRIVSPRRFSWEEALSCVSHGVALGDLFSMPLEDDANAPDFPRGQEFIWSTVKPAQIGSLVLVRDKAGQVHARQMRQGKAAQHWIAAPSNVAFASLDSIADGLEVVAVAAYKAMP